MRRSRPTYARRQQRRACYSCRHVVVWTCACCSCRHAVVWTCGRVDVCVLLLPPCGCVAVCVLPLPPCGRVAVCDMRACGRLAFAAFAAIVYDPAATSLSISYLPRPLAPSLCLSRSLTVSFFLSHSFSLSLSLSLCRCLCLCLCLCRCRCLCLCLCLPSRYLLPLLRRLLCTVVSASVALARCLPLTHAHLSCTQRYPLLSLVDAQRSPRRIPPDDPEKVQGKIFDNDQ